MRFCEKCGLKLGDDTVDCINCRNILLVDNDKSGIRTSIVELNSNSTKKVIDFQTYVSKTSNEPMDYQKPFRFPSLIVVKGGTENREFPVSREISNIGRWDPNLKSNPEIDLSDEDIDAKVSRLHARIIRKPEGYYLEDIGSRNGTFLNREFRLVQGIEYSLKDNDEIIIGHIFFRFQLNLS